MGLRNERMKLKIFKKLALSFTFRVAVLYQILLGQTQVKQPNYYKFHVISSKFHALQQ